MYAVIKTGGKQFKVENEQKILVNRINADEGSIVTVSYTHLRAHETV